MFDCLVMIENFQIPANLTPRTSFLFGVETSESFSDHNLQSAHCYLYVAVIKGEICDLAFDHEKIFEVLFQIFDALSLTSALGINAGCGLTVYEMVAHCRSALTEGATEESKSSGSCNKHKDGETR